MSDGPASIIGRGTRIEGTLRFTGALRIEGSVHGEVRGEGKPHAAALALGPDGSIVGSVTGVDLRSEGTLEGVVTEAGAVELLPDSKTSGEITYESLQVRHGAVLNCLMRPRRPAAG